jgi:hypothetical protein
MNGKIIMKYKIKCGTIVTDFSVESTSVDELVALIMKNVLTIK